MSLTARTFCLGRRPVLIPGLVWSLALAAHTVAADCAREAGAVALPPAGFRFAAVGDIIIQQPSASIIEARAREIVRRLREADVSFGNFESNSFELDAFAGHARPPPEGPLLLAPPEVPRELAAMGLKLVSTANNHAGDWGPEGVLATARTLREAGLVSAGTGRDLRSARAAACTRVPGAAVALAAVTATFEDSDAATAGKAGVNPLHLKAHDSGDGMDETDRRALVASIQDARRRADLVFFSLHAHQAGASAEQPPRFERELAHEAIDAGADVFVGHGPHVLRGIEIYKGRVIFYSLGNFAVTQPPSRINPTPLSLPKGSVFTRRAFFQSILATGRYERGRLIELELYPFELADTPDPQTHGLPEAVSPSEGRTILEQLRTLSRPFGTSLSIEGGVGKVRVSAP